MRKHLIVCERLISGKSKYQNNVHSKFRVGPNRIGIQVLYSGFLWPRNAFTTAGVQLKQKFSFSNFCPGRGFNPGPRSLMAVNVTTRLRRTPNSSLQNFHRDVMCVITQKISCLTSFYKSNLFYLCKKSVSYACTSRLYKY